ncbi:MAG: hypothetical protein ACRD2A_02080 [Vicinamibacterales bacterium]
MVLDVTTNRERNLADVDTVHTGASVLRWSWDDTEIVYQELGGIFALSTTDGSRRLLARVALRDETKTWKDLVVHSLDWLHERSQVVADVSDCVAMREQGKCEYQHHVMLSSGDRLRPLAMGTGVAVSPTGDRIAFATKDSLQIIDADGSNRRPLVSVPRVPLFPWVREDTEQSRLVWSPNGNRLWFGTAGGEEYSTTQYLVDVQRGTRRRVVSDGFVEIVAWR